MRYGAERCTSAHLESLDSFFFPIQEVLGQALKLCPLSDAAEATDLAGDRVLVGCASKCEDEAHFFSSE